MGVGDGSLASLFSWWWGDGAPLLLHSLCGDWRLDPFAPWGLGQLSGAQPTAGLRAAF